MKIDMKVVQILPLKNQVFRVFLQALPALIFRKERQDSERESAKVRNPVSETNAEDLGAFSYVAGQYLEVVLSDRNVPLSIANAEFKNEAKDLPIIELHVRHTPGHTISDALIKAFQESYQTAHKIKVQLPFGHSTIECLSPTRPTILVARGTGFSPIKAIIEAMIQKKWSSPVHLYWGVRLSDDYYLQELLEQWMNLKEKGVFDFSYTPLVSPEDTDTLIDAVIKNYKDLSSYQIIAAGPFDLMFKARDIWCAYGLKREHMYSDAFLGE